MVSLILKLYEQKLKNIIETNSDLNKEIEDLQKTCNDMLLEKEQFNTKINNLAEIFQDISILYKSNEENIEYFSSFSEYCKSLSNLYS